MKQKFIFWRNIVVNILLTLSFTFGFGQITNSFTYSGGLQNFTVPSGVTSITVQLWGAGGGQTSYRGSGNGGSGGYVSGTISVTPGETLTVLVGGGGGATYDLTTSKNGGIAGYGGGAAGGSSTTGGYGGGGGGGRSAIRRSSTELVTAGGGGGAGGYYNGVKTPSGGGAGADGYNQNQTQSGTGAGLAGTTVSGGSGGVGFSTTGTSGTQYTGGAGASAGNFYAGGGGGGYYGGGGGGANNTSTTNRASGAGGGGSNYVGGLASIISNTNGNSGTSTATVTPPNIADPNYSSGVGCGYAFNNTTNTLGGNGLVVITYIPPAITITPSAPSICSGSSTSLTASSSVGYTYTWSPSTGLSSTTGATVTANPTSTITYTVTGTLGAMTTTKTVTVTVNPAPTTVDITNSNASICPNTVQTLTATGGVIANQTAYSEDFSSLSGWAFSGSTSGLLGAFFASSNAGGTSPEGALYYSTSANGSWYFYPYSGSVSNYFPINISNYTSLNFSFKYYFDTFSGAYTRGIYLDVSTDGINFTNVWSATPSGVSNSSGAPSINLSSYIGNANIYFRFRYTGDSAGMDFWYLDDIAITGNKQVITWSPTTNLYTNAGCTIAYTAGSYATTVYAKPTSTITYTASATTGTCSSSDTVTFTVKTPVAITSATAATSPICSNATTTLTANGVVGTNAVVTWYSGPGATGTNFGIGTTLLNAAPGTYYAYVTGDCGTPAEASVTVGSIALPTANIISNNGPICSGNNAVFNLSGTSGAVVTYNINGGSNTTITLVGGTATVTLTGVTASQTLNLVSVNNGSCTDTLSGNSTVSLTTTVWNGISWSNGLPASNKSIEFQGNYTSSGNLQACSCIITSGTVTVSSGNTVTLLNEMKVNGGSITFKSGSNLLQTNNVANTGNIIIERDASTPSTQYSYWSSPVSGQYMRYIYNGSNTSAASNAPYILYYNTLDDKFYNVASTLAVAGMGYAVKGKPGVTSGSYTATFTGVPNNGDITYYNKTLSTGSTSLRIDGSGYNLVGNPYPSNLDLNVLYDENKTTSTGNIGPNFWLWDYVGNTTYGQIGSTYNGANYGVYNAPSGTGNKASNSGKTPDGYVFVGQGFIVKALGANQGLKFNNASNMRTTTTSTTTYQKSAVSNTDRYWLKIVSPIGNYHTTAVVYKAGAQNVFDDYDSEVLNVASDDIYSLVDTRNVNINGRAPFNVSDVVPLGVSTFQTGNYTISLDGVEGIFNGGQAIYLHDKQTGSYTDLTQGNYTFSIASTGINTGRFEVVYVPDGTLGINTTEKSKLLVYRHGDNFIVKSDKKITSLELLDASGRMMKVVQPNNNEAIIEGVTLPQGIYLIRINRQGEVVTQKVRK